MKTLFLLAIALLLAACGLVSLSPEQHMALVDYFGQELAAGRISQAQHDALIEALSQESVDWQQVVWWGVQLIGGIAGATWGVNALHGGRPPAEERERRRALAKGRKAAGLPALNGQP